MNAPLAPVIAPGAVEALLLAVARLAGEIAAQIVEQRVGAAEIRYATARDNPLGSARAFLDAARRGDFRSFRRGRATVARWDDVVAWIESRPARRRASQVQKQNLEAELRGAATKRRARRG